jgi:uncharacterized membrane protein
MKIFNFLIEIIIFGIVMVIFGFIVSYITDFISNKPITWFPDHGLDMATGTFFTGVIVYILFSKLYLKIKCKYDKN